MQSHARREIDNRSPSANNNLPTALAGTGRTPRRQSLSSRFRNAAAIVDIPEMPPPAKTVIMVHSLTGLARPAPTFRSALPRAAPSALGSPFPL